MRFECSNATLEELYEYAAYWQSKGRKVTLERFTLVVV